MTSIRRYSSLAVLGLLGVFVAARIRILFGGHTYTSFDTFSYAHRGDPAWDRGPLVSFTGHAPRPWGVPLFYAMFPDDQARAVGQWTISTLAWGFLAVALSLLMRHWVARIVAAGGILAVSLLQPVVNWDFAILSESLSISLGALTVGFFLWWQRTRAVWAVVATTLAGIWWIFTRLDMFILIVPIGAAFALYAWRRRRRDDRRQVLATSAAAVVLALTAGWSYAITPVTIDTFQRWSYSPQMEHERGLLMYRLRLSVYGDPEVKQVFQRELGMPACEGADRIAAGSAWAVEEFAAEVDKCPELRAWSDGHLSGLWTQYATTAPGLFTQQIAGYTSDALVGATYAQAPSVLPGAVQKLAFPRSHALPIALLALALASLLAWACGAWRRHRGLLVTAAAIAGWSLVSTVATVVVSAGELWRFGIQEAIGLRVAVVILLACAVDALQKRIGREARSAEEATEAAAAPVPTSTR